ncbi:MAG TPA: sugar ABC transporter permease [Anaerolineales bacterium]|nr:sugar ABC transporter permease [Anaerolineales bacterium]
MKPASTFHSRLSRTIEPYLYLTPAAIFIGLVFFYPIIWILQSSLWQNNLDGTKGFGFTNYRLVFEDPVFFQVVANNGKLLFSVPIMTLIALFLAIVLFERVRGWMVYRGIVFMPYILAIPVVGTTFIYLLGLNGIFNTMLRGVGLGAVAQDWIGSADWVIPSIAAVIIYRELGFGVVLFLARLMSLDKEILEAAEIDGANWWQKHAYITLPQMSAVIEFFVIVELITMLSWVFAYVYTMTGGGPGFASTVMEFYIWKHAFAYRSPGIASALAVVLLGVTTVLIVLQLRLRRRALEEIL